MRRSEFRSESRAGLSALLPGPELLASEGVVRPGVTARRGLPLRKETGLRVLSARRPPVQLCNEPTSVTPTCCSVLRRCKGSSFLISSNTKSILIFSSPPSNKRDINKVTRLRFSGVIESGHRFD